MWVSRQPEAYSYRSLLDYDTVYLCGSHFDPEGSSQVGIQVQDDAAEQVDLAVMLCTCIVELLGLIVRRVTGMLTGFPWFSSVPPGKWRLRMF
jgi:hypothetical protein